MSGERGENGKVERANDSFGVVGGELCALKSLPREASLRFAPRGMSGAAFSNLPRGVPSSARRRLRGSKLSKQVRGGLFPISGRFPGLDTIREARLFLC